MEKLDSKSLMIGDWVLYDEEYYRVSELCYNDKVITLIQENKYSTTEAFASENLVTPIPLTEEILKKNGFLGNDYGEIIIGEWRIMCDCLNVAILHNEHVCIDIPIHYVHELQHALKLCKIDNEIEL